MCSDVIICRAAPAANEPFRHDLEGIWTAFNMTVPPEARKDPDELANEQLIASIEGFTVPEPPEYPALALAA